MKNILATTVLSTALFISSISAQQIGGLTNYSLNSTGHDIVRDIAASDNFAKITVGSYQPSTNSPYNGFIYSDHPNNDYDWRVTIGSNGNDEVNAVDVQTPWNGTEYVEEIYVTGYFTGTVTFTRVTWGLPYGTIWDIFTMNSPYGSNDCTYFIAKFNRSGYLVWIQYSGNTAESNTEIGNDVDVCVVGSEVQVYTAGFYRGNPYFYQGSTPTIQVTSATSWNSAFTAKYVDNGSSATLSWVKKVNDDANNQHDYGYGVCGDETGNVFMCGSIGGTTTVITGLPMNVEGNDDALVVKYLSDGTPDFAMDFGGNGTIQTPSDQARCITFRNNELYVSGYYNGTGGAMLTGSANSIDAFLFKLNAGNGLYVKRNFMKNTTGADVSYKHCHSQDGEKVFVGGQMTGDLTIYCNSPTPSGHVVESPNYGYFANGFFISFNAADMTVIDHEWVAGYDNTCAITTVETISNDEVRIGGVFKDYWVTEREENFTATNSNVYTNIYNDGLLGYYDCDELFNLAPASVHEQSNENASALKLQVFPNPAVDQITLSKKTDESALVEVIDLSGRTVLSGQMNGVQLIIDITSLDAGSYIVRIAEGNQIESVRIVKQ